MSEAYVQRLSSHELRSVRAEAGLAHLATMASVLGDGSEILGVPDDFGSSGPPGVGSPAPNTIAAIHERLDRHPPIDEL